MASKGKKRFKQPQARGSGMMRQIEQLQQQMAEAQAALEEEVVTASVGGGAITIQMTGAQELRSITIQPEVLDPDDVEMLQDLILSAFAKAQDMVSKLTQEKMGPLAGGLGGVPGLF